jgi:hypothetical protein
MKITLVLQGNILTYENDAITEVLEMGHAFGDGEEGHEFCKAQTWQNFIGTALHLIQQTGGVLTLNGQEISAATFEGTAGDPVTKDTLVMLEDSEKIPLAYILRL